MERVGVEGGGEQADRTVPGGKVLAGGGEPIEPRRVDIAGAHLGAVEQVEEERLVGRAAADDHRRLGERSREPGARLVAGAARGDHLGDHRVELRWDHVALGDAGVDPDPGSDGERQCLDHSRRRRERPLRILGVEPGLDGVARRRWRIALEAAAVGDVELQLHEVETRRLLGDRVLDLEPGVDLEEGEQPLVGLVEELDGAGVLVPGGGGQPHGGGTEIAILLGGERRAVRLLDHLLVAALEAAVADAHRPHRAVGVADDLHLDVAGAGDDTFDEHGRIAERLLALGAGARRTPRRAGRDRRRGGCRALHRRRWP